MTVLTEATTAGIGSGTASVSASVYDPLKANNFAVIEVQVEAPSLGIAGAAGSYQLSWSRLATNYVLEEATNLLQTTWTPVALSSGQYIYTVPVTSGSRFFRLRTQVP